jgi:DMSO/TMAO reductase YedYZ molybdopterin-dependent catalytic subunit
MNDYISRREFLKEAGLAVGGGAAGFLALVNGCKKGVTPTTGLPATVSSTGIDLGYLAYANPAEVDNSGLPVTPVSGLHVAGGSRDISAGKYKLSVYGLVENPYDLTYNRFRTLPGVKQTTLLICPGAFADNPDWTGVRVATLLASAGVKAGAQKINFHSVGDDHRQIPLSDALADGVILADKVDGLALPAAHGFPVRLVLPGFYGSYWLKWVNGIEVT